MELEWKIFIATALFTVIQSFTGFLLWRFIQAVDKLSEAVEHLSLSRAKVEQRLDEHERRHESHELEFSKINQRCFEQLRNQHRA